SQYGIRTTFTLLSIVALIEGKWSLLSKSARLIPGLVFPFSTVIPGITLVASTAGVFVAGAVVAALARRIFGERPQNLNGLLPPSSDDPSVRPAPDVK